MATSPTAKGSLSIIKDGAVSDVFVFQYNPSSRSMSHSVQYNMSSPPGSALPFAFFGSIDGPSFSLSFLLDATANYSASKQGTRAQKAFFESLVQPDIDQFMSDLATFTKPPEVRYSMGGDSFPILVTGSTVRDVRFNNQGFETRTVIDLECQLYFTSPAQLKSRLERLRRLREQVVRSE